MNRSKLKPVAIFFSVAVHLHIMIAQFSPGDLAEKHAHLTGNLYCAECHSKGKTVDQQDCLNCHSPIRNRIDQKSGYHGIDAKTNCINCHSDHNGSAFRMIFWENGKDNFIHKETGYILEGKHVPLDCDKCHTDKFVQAVDVITWEKNTRRPGFLSATFLGLSAECSGCHENIHKNDVLTRQASVFSGKACSDCHNQEEWKAASKTFDHSTTQFPLKMSHDKQDCIKCHRDITYIEKIDLTFSGTFETRKCIQCHNDIHLGSYGKTCETCHTEDDWKKPSAFNHGKTNFPLKAKHTPVVCAKCHIPQSPVKKNPACRDCHEDKHQNQFFAGPKWKDCFPCHQESGWTPSFYSFRDHDQCLFPLRGAHQAVPCVSCHVVSSDTPLIVRYTGIPHRCTSCHIDIHQNQFSDLILKNDCTSCHTPSGWEITAFDHRRTRYPLDGKHVNVPCDKCHPSEDGTLEGVLMTMTRYKPLGIECVDCHLNQLYKSYDND